MSALLKKRAKERAAALERRLRGEDGSGDEGGEEVEELAVYEVTLQKRGLVCDCDSKQFNVFFSACISFAWCTSSGSGLVVWLFSEFFLFLSKLHRKRINGVCRSPRR